MGSLLFAIQFVPAFAAEHDHEDSVKVETEVKKGGDEKKNEIPPEKAVVTNHSVVRRRSQHLSYKATAGTLIIRDDKGKPDASVFYVAYTARRRFQQTTGDISVQRRSGFGEHLAAHGFVRAGAGA